MTTLELCKSIVNYEDNTLMNNFMSESLSMAKGKLSNSLENDEFVDYVNNGIEEDDFTVIITEDDDDDSKYIDIVTTKIVGFLYLSSFTDDYEFLNGKVGSIVIGDDYNYARYDCDSDFTTVYSKVLYAGNVTSSWSKDMQMAEAKLAIHYFLMMARRISQDLSIYVSGSYGDSTITPVSVLSLKSYRDEYKREAFEIIRRYSLAKRSLVDTGTSYTNDWTLLKTEYSYISMNE